MDTFLTVAYLGAGILFIQSLGGLASQESSRRGNVYGILGMIIALLATMVHGDVYQPEATQTHTIMGLSPQFIGSFGAAIVIGGGIGAFLAKRVEMTAMPELVAALHSFVGLAAVLVGFSCYLTAFEGGHDHLTIHLSEIYIDVIDEYKEKYG